VEPVLSMASALFNTKQFSERCKCIWFRYTSRTS